MAASKTSHAERTVAEPRAKELLNVRLSRVEQVNRRIRLLRLDLLSGPITFAPGQWLDTFVPGIAKAGGFTITSPPSVASQDHSPYLELAIQESPENSVAAWLWKPSNEIIGLSLRIRVGGSFVFPPTSHPRLSGIKRVIFVAGGVGVNPLMSMLSYMREHADCHGVEIDFHYATRLFFGDNATNILFLKRISSLLGNGGLQGKLTLYLTGVSSASTEPSGYEQLGTGATVLCRKGRPPLESLRDAATEFGYESTLVYVCGPPNMTDEVVGTLAKDVANRGNPPSNIFTERWW